MGNIPDIKRACSCEKCDMELNWERMAEEEYVACPCCGRIYCHDCIREYKFSNGKYCGQDVINNPDSFLCGYCSDEY